ncbi:MAG: FitA-like ribbon-helix-helix domain-containing protein [Leucobacter sp.]
MAQLLIRKLPDAVKDGLHERARGHGRSMEAEARKILIDFILPSEGDPVLVWLAESERLREQDPDFEFELPERGPAREVVPL